MEYRYPPLYKYIAFFIILFLFLRHYKQITQDKYLIISILITLLVVLLDYMLIFDHPSILQTKEEFDPDDLDDILDDGTTYDSTKSNVKEECVQQVRPNPNPVHNRRHVKKPSSELPVLKPLTYIDDDDDNLNNNNYSEYEMQNMMNLHGMQNMKMQNMDSMHGMNHMSNIQYSKYPSINSDPNQYY